MKTTIVILTYYYLLSYFSVQKKRKLFYCKGLPNLSDEKEISETSSPKVTTGTSTCRQPMRIVVSG